MLKVMPLHHQMMRMKIMYNATGIRYVIEPFTREIDINLRFNLPQFEEAAEGLFQAVQKRTLASFIAPAGCGKTVVLRNLMERLPEARYQVGYIKVADLSQRDMCREIAHTIGAKTAGAFHSLVRNVQDHFSTTHGAQGRQPVLLIDDAHEMRPLTVSILKLLTNFKMDSKLLVSIILTGQPKMRDLLKREELQDIAQRIYHHTELRLLSAEESKDYLHHRCTVAGLSPFPFDDSATQSIFVLSRGNMRVMDLLCLKSLELASKRNLSGVGESLIMEAKKTIWT